MYIRGNILVAVVAVLSVALAGCTNHERKRGNERWVTTEDTNVKIDWDKINEAYKQAEGPQDFEKRVNEIYEGSEIISVAVHDLDAKTQEVTGFFDKNQSGAVDDGEKVFTIKRDVVDEGSAQYQITGHGHYGHYRSPIWDLAAGMMLGSMISSALRPGYAPMYTRPYVTSTGRVADLKNHRQQYRAKNPGRFGQSKASGSGRSYNNKGSRSWGSQRSTGSRRSFGGGRFGIRKRRKRGQTPQRLTS